MPHPLDHLPLKWKGKSQLLSPATSWQMFLHQVCAAGLDTGVNLGSSSRAQVRVEHPQWQRVFEPGLTPLSESTLHSLPLQEGGRVLGLFANDQRHLCLKEDLGSRPAPLPSLHNRAMRWA